jgi:ribosomal-protein-alanine N-acetyltransferase
VLKGRLIELRPVREADLNAMYAAHVNIADRGDYFPLGFQSEPAFRREFSENGFWEREAGTMLIISLEGETVGQIEFFKYWDAFELSFQLYGEGFAGRGYTTEAVQLLVDYLFATKKQHRIQLLIVPENTASCRVAEKCGFVLEGTVRAAFFNHGRNHDMLLYSLLRTDPRPWSDS